MTKNINCFRNGSFLAGQLIFFSLSLSFKCALRESSCRTGYEPTKMSQDHFWRSMFRTNVEASAFCNPLILNDNKNGHIQAKQN